MKSRFVAAALVLLGAVSVWGHHSLAAEFDQSKNIQIVGKATKLDWRNPHAWLYVDVKTADGKIEKWQCELGSPNAMTRAGFGPDAIKPGDDIRIEGYPAKKDAHTLSTRQVYSPDGTLLLRQ